MELVEAGPPREGGGGGGGGGAGAGGLLTPGPVVKLGARADTRKLYISLLYGILYLPHPSQWGPLTSWGPEGICSPGARASSRWPCVEETLQRLHKNGEALVKVPRISWMVWSNVDVN